ncbi:MAG: hypothetical protein OEY28_14175 [Nitrospira sp.]|nr:hypothetical protein [Nitrospira sp.]
MQNPYSFIVESIYAQHHQSIRIRLGRRFPRVSHALVEDAVADAFMDALQRPTSFMCTWQQDGTGALRRLIEQVAWRSLRGYLRKKSSRCELFSAAAIEAAAESYEQTASIRIEQREKISRALRLIDIAAVRFGGSRSRSLRSALHARLEGYSDTEAARDHRIPREYVNRAKRWIGCQMRVDAL